MSPRLETLRSGDEERLEAFLSRHAASSMFLRSNAREAGLDDDGALYQGTYVAAVGPSGIEAVAGHFWNGIVVLQAPEHLAPVARAAVARSGRHVAGLAGPWAQVLAARAALDLGEREVSRESPEVLYQLSLAELRPPAPRSDGCVRCVVPAGGWLGPALELRVAFCVEALALADTPALREGAHAELSRAIERRSTFALLDDDEVRAVASFNARLPDCVQLGGVYTPPRWRSRGYGRAVVAGALEHARAAGVRQAVLFTEDDNVPARLAYEALGFTAVGDYGLCLFRA